MFEVILLVGACFLVNYVTADAKTNWAEGWVLVSYYVMIVSAPPLRYLTAWITDEIVVTT
jgi:Ca2+/H+ antiporter